MATNNNEFWYRILFKIKLYESHGTSFQQLINTLFQYSLPGFQAIEPWGSWGDGGNDGWIQSSGSYYQIYGPKPQSTQTPTAAVSKAVSDFEKLPKKWEDVDNYYFVYNDRYLGAPAPVASALQKLQKDHPLSDARVMCGADLERLFMELPCDVREVLVGGIPGCDIASIDPRSIGELLSYLADKPSSLPAFLDESAPDLDDKIQLNGLVKPVSNFLSLYLYQVSVVEEFLSRREAGLTQSIAEEVRRLYSDSKTTIPDSDNEAPNIRYVWMVDQLIPPSARSHPHSMKAYRDAAQVILSKYFETCDAYEHPNSASTT